jgi:hypothetical protein|tara:strand:+ start:1311 stop:2114 length:804 start_codon:yes stop_codon:yes gene_type:complete
MDPCLPSNQKKKNLNQMNKSLSLSFAIFGVSSTALLNAAVIAEWTFDTGADSTARLASSGVPTGATISGLSFNSSFTDVGPGAVPNDVHDGFGFGGNAGDQVIFLHRANYFDGSAVPSPRLTLADYTSWGQGSAQGTGGNLLSNGNAPISFTIGAGALSSVTVDSLTIDFTSGGASIWQIQEAGAAEGAQGTLNPGNPLITVALNAPVEIGAGESKTFTINVNSGALNSLHNIDGLSLNGTVASIPEPSSGILLCLGALALTRRQRK